MVQKKQPESTTEVTKAEVVEAPKAEEKVTLTMEQFELLLNKSTAPVIIEPKKEGLPTFVVEEGKQTFSGILR